MEISELAAFHEAAHAVAAARIGLVFDHEIGVGDRRTAWRSLMGDEQPWPKPMTAMVLLAGSIAEAHAARMNEGPNWGLAETDHSRNVLSLTDEELGQAVHETLLLVEQQWTAIEGVAGQLLSGRRLTFDQVEAFVLWPRGY